MCDVTGPMYHLTTTRVIVRRDGVPVAVIARSSSIKDHESERLTKLILDLLNAHAAGLVKLPGED